MARQTRWPYWRFLRAMALNEAQLLRSLMHIHGEFPRCVSMETPSVEDWRAWRRQEQERARVAAHGR